MILPVSKLYLAPIRKVCRRLVGGKSAARGSSGSTRLLGILASGLFLLTIPLHAQVAAAISGTIEDPSGAGVGGAKVTVVDEPVYAGADGALQLAVDMPGEYWQQLR